jgi:hypothetical protein
LFIFISTSDPLKETRRFPEAKSPCLILELERVYPLFCRQVIWIIMSYNTGGEERVPDNITGSYRALKSGELKTFPPPSEATNSKEASSQFLVQLLLPACSSQCPQTPRAASCSQAKPFTQLHNHYDPLLGLRLKIFSFL